MSITLRKMFKQALWAFMSFCFTLFVLIGVYLLYVDSQLPDVSVLKDKHLQVPLKIYTRDGKLIAQYGTKRRIPIPFSAIPPQMVDAVLAVEDARYYHHAGVDIIGLFRAAKAVILSGKKVQGASTITMQVARNFFLTKKKTYSRKIKEILLALKIDKKLSKDKVLDLYLNKVYFGSRAYGVAAAAQVYYGKPLAQLSLAQMAMIGGLPQAPSKNNPIVNPVQAKERRNHVLLRMLDVGFITKKQYEYAIAQPVTATYHVEKIAFHAPYVAELVRQILVKDFGQAAYDDGLTVVTTIDGKMQQAAQRALESGLINYSKRHGFVGPIKNFGMPNTLNQSQWLSELKKMPKYNLVQPGAVIKIQDKSIDVLLSSGSVQTIEWSGLSWAKRALGNNLFGSQPKQASDIVKLGDVVWVANDGKEWSLSQLPKVQGALVSMDPDTGGLLAMVGGYDYSLSKFNRASQALRQPGSCFKPFIYSAALAKGYTLASTINDAPVVMTDSGENELWRPHNDNFKFYGPTRLRVGLAESRNLVSIRLLQDITIPYALQFITKFGFAKDSLPQSLSLALGSVSVTPLQLARGYAVFANGGFRVQPHLIESISDQNQKVLYKADFGNAKSLDQQQTSNQGSAIKAKTASQSITWKNAYVMTQALQGVIQNGTGSAARVLKRDDLAGKTGTTNKQVDAWFSGYNARVLSVVWVGYDNLTSLHEYGSQAALPIWINYMRQALKGTIPANLSTPPGIVSVRIDPRNGLLARPAQSNAIFELFRQQFVPKEYSSTGSSNPYLTGSGSGGSVGQVQSDGGEPLF